MRLKEMNFLKRLFCQCPEVKSFTRWVEFWQKKNKPKEKLLEVLEVCTGCKRVVRSGYFTQEQIDKKYLETMEQIYKESVVEMENVNPVITDGFL